MIADGPNLDLMKLLLDWNRSWIYVDMETMIWFGVLLLVFQEKILKNQFLTKLVIGIKVHLYLIYLILFNLLLDFPRDPFVFLS